MTSQPTDARECLGEVSCIEPGCGGVEYVYRSKRKGRHLYGRCARCGINQKTGAQAQARLAQFVPVGTLSQTETNPAEPPQTEPQTVQEPDALTDFDPSQAEPRTVQEATPKRSGRWFGLAFLMLFLVSLPAAMLRGGK